MLYMKNLPHWERGLRLVGGMAVAAYGLSALNGVAAWMLLAMGGGLALSGLIGFCPMCAMAGRRLQKRQEKT